MWGMMPPPEPELAAAGARGMIDVQQFERTRAIAAGYLADFPLDPRDAPVCPRCEAGGRRQRVVMTGRHGARPVARGCTGGVQCPECRWLGDLLEPVVAPLAKPPG